MGGLSDLLFMCEHCFYRKTTSTPKLFLFKEVVSEEEIGNLYP